MRKYENYQEVLSLWVQSIPFHWEFNKLRSIFWQRKEKNEPVKTKDILSLSAKAGVELYSQKARGGGNKAKDDITKYNIAHEGDLIVNCMNIISGAVGLSKYYGAISPVYYALVTRNENFDKNYYEYLFKIEPFQKSLLPLGRGILIHESSTGKLNTIRMRISMADFNNVYLPVPPKEEQEQIVRYLDWKVSHINRLIHGYQRQTKLLEEYKKAQITHLVTHGIEKHKMIDSEIYWLESVPKDWRVTRLKHILKKQQRSIPENAELLICSNSGEVKVRGESKMGLVAESDDIYQGVKKGDLLIHGMDTWHGAIAVSDFDGMCTPVVHVCTSNESVRFVAYYLKMMAYTKVFKAISNGVRQNTSDFRSWDKAGALYIALPSLEEQEMISDKIDDVISKINNSISVINREIDTLKEYRTRLISDVVTGQIDVRDIEIPDYTLVEDNTLNEEIDDIEEVSDDAE